MRDRSQGPAEAPLATLRPTEVTSTRQRVTVFHADVAHYCQHMCRDEVGTQRLVIAYLDVLESHIAANGGSVCHFAGDAVLARFPEPSHGVSAAINAQLELREHNRGLAPMRRVEFRIGLNVTDALVARGEVYGTGVNITARLQARATPGAICLSERLRQEVGIPPVAPLDDLGELKLKHISEPVRAWNLEIDAMSLRLGHVDRCPSEVA